MRDEFKKCCICGKTFEGFGNNPAPIKNEGTCCSHCNDLVVVPARIEAMMTCNDKQLEGSTCYYGKKVDKFDSIVVGEKTLLAGDIPTGQTGAISTFQGETLIITYCHPSSTRSDIEAFTNAKIEFGYIGDKSNGLTMPIIRMGHHFFEVPFNLHVVPDNGYDEFYKSTGGAILLQYVNSITKEVVAIRYFYPNETLKQSLMDVGLATVNNHTAENQYQQWVGEVFARYTAKDNFKRSRKLGYVKGGLTPSCWMNLSPAMVLSEG